MDFRLVCIVRFRVLRLFASLEFFKQILKHNLSCLLFLYPIVFIVRHEFLGIYVRVVPKCIFLFLIAFLGIDGLIIQYYLTRKIRS